MFKTLLLKEGITFVVEGLSANFFIRRFENLIKFLQCLLVVPIFEKCISDIEMQFGRIGLVYKRIAIYIERFVVIPTLVVFKCLSTFLRHRIPGRFPAEYQPGSETQ